MTELYTIDFLQHKNGKRDESERSARMLARIDNYVIPRLQGEIDRQKENLQGWVDLRDHLEDELEGRFAD